MCGVVMRGDGPVEVPERLVADDRGDLGAPAEQPRVLLDGEQPAGAADRLQHGRGCPGGRATGRRSPRQSMPRAASASAAASARGTIRPSATIVASFPGRRTFAVPSASTIVAVGHVALRRVEPLVLEEQHRVVVPDRRPP